MINIYIFPVKGSKQTQVGGKGEERGRERERERERMGLIRWAGGWWLRVVG